MKVAADMGDEVEERRTRQVSNITDKTAGCSMQHSEDNNAMFSHRSSCSPRDRPSLRKNLSNIDNLAARSRGISNDLNLATNQTASQSSLEDASPYHN